jgi:Ca2+-binding EF-hand superfamily protein
MSMREYNKEKTSSFQQNKRESNRNSTQKFGYSPDKSQSKINRAEAYNVRFQRKDLREFEAGLYVTGSLTYQDVMDLKEVFDAYDSTGMGVLLPNDLKLMLTQNGFDPNRKTTYEIVAEFDAEETGGISFIEFMKAMDTKPFRNESKKEIAAIFKKYDRDNKNYLTIDDIKEVNGHVK